ncbi:urokinase plasminogen activator surface receptor-like [Megalobrama amblycephala]|uniref:urokinase plasminogen activator surface receptor-like n=1 Tax=Megalobrama amblycephala TaxID=75352 RepID=UPI0020143A93|nr:urokinase plasminogen activator surface receptor-like [Megalobrama amblycephala]
MDLQLSVFLFFILFTGGHSLSCYECISVTGSCADQTVTTCPSGSSHCMSSTVVTPIGDNTTEVKFKGCAPSFSCLYPSFSSADVSFFCCNTDLCNAKNAELSGDSSSNVVNVPNVPNIPNFPNFPNVPNIPNFPNFPNIPNVSNVPNGKKCYYCSGNSCSNIMDCSGTEDRCFTATVAYGGQSVVAKSCLSKAVCDAATSNPNVASVSCCEGNLCNGAQSVSQSFLFLCCSLLSYFLLH